MLNDAHFELDLVARELGPSPGRDKGGFATVGQHDDTVVVPDAQLLFNADFHRSGQDLVLTGEDGRTFTVYDYFAAERRPTLSTANGASLGAAVVEALAGPANPGEYAQAAATAAATAPIGRVEKVTGSATVIRNGVSITLNVGDAVLKGDVVQTGRDSSLGISFIDGTAFSLASSARMVLNELVYDPNGTNNSALLSLVEGTISFVAGKVAKTGDMRVETPVATMGIRGTAVLVEIGANSGTTKFAVMTEPDGHVGSFNLYSKTTGQVLATISVAGMATTVTPTAQITQAPLSTQEIQIQQQVVQILQIYSMTQQAQPQNAPAASQKDVPQPGTEPGATPPAPAAPITKTDSGGAGGSGTSSQVVSQQQLGVPTTGTTSGSDPIATIVTTGPTSVATLASTPASPAPTVTLAESPSQPASQTVPPPAPVVVTPTIKLVSGTVIDGYVHNATVFLDANANGVFDAGEASGSTDSSGHFVLTAPVASQGRLIVSGGIDTGTGLPLKGTLMAPDGYAMVTAISTLVAELAGPNASASAIAAVEARLATSFGLTGVSFGTSDPIQTAQSGSHNLLLADSKLLDTVVILASALQSAHPGSTFGAAFSDVLQALATEVANGENLGTSLSLDAFVLGVLQTAATASGTTLDSSFAAAVAQVAAATNALVAVQAGSSAVVSDVNGVIRLVQGEITDAVAQLGALSIDPAQASAFAAALQNVLSHYTGSALSDALGLHYTSTDPGGHVLAEAADTVGSSVVTQLSGALSFTDAHPERSHTVTSALVLATDSTGHVAPAATLAALAAAITASLTDTSSSGPGSIGWTFSLADTFADFLSVGETLTVVYNFTVRDAGGSQATQAVAIMLTGSNDAPVATVDPLLSGVFSLTDQAGEHLLVVGGIRFTDDFADVHHTVQIAAFAGVAITGIQAVGGYFEYSLDGTVWTPLGAVGEDAALLLRSTDQLRFVSGGGTGSGTLTYHAWSEAGQAGDRVDLTGNGATGGTSAFGSHTQALSFSGIASVGGGVVSSLFAHDTFGTPIAGYSEPSLGHADPSTDSTGLVQWQDVFDQPDIDALHEGETRTNSFTITIRDDHGGSTRQNVHVTITGANDAPDAVADTTSVAGGRTVAASNRAQGVLGNDTDPDSGETASLVVSAVAAGSGPAIAVTSGSATIVDGLYGHLTIGADGLYSYEADHAAGLPQGQQGADVFTYTVVDVDGLTSTSTLTVAATGGDHAPLAVADTTSVAGGQTVAALNRAQGVLGNDTDPDSGETASLVVSAVAAGSGPAIAVTSVSATIVDGLYGHLTIGADGLYSYEADHAAGLPQGQQGADVFTYTVVDVDGLTSTATLTVAVTGGDHAPLAVADTTSVAGGRTVAASNRAQGVLGNDTDPDSGETASLVVSAVAAGSGPAIAVTSGSATIVDGLYGHLTIGADGLYSYEADHAAGLPQGQQGADVFTYTVVDVDGLTSTSTLTVAATGGDHAPLAVADTTSVAGGQTVAALNRAQGVLGNDTDPDSGETASLVVSAVAAGSGPAIAVTSVSATIVDGLYGHLTIGADGLYSYEADHAAGLPQGQQGADVFTYTVVDADGLTSTATLTVAVTGGNRAPTGAGGVTSQHATSNAIANGGFETGDFSGWTLSGQLDHTFVTGPAHGGLYAAKFGQVGGIGYLSQNIQTVAGQHYGLTFWLSNDGGTQSSFSATWNGSTIVGSALANTAPQNFTQYSFDVVGVTGSSVLQFAFRQDPAYWHIDDVFVSGGTGGPLKADGNVAFADADTFDIHTASFVPVSGAGYIGTFSLDATVSESGGSGSVGWHFVVDPADIPPGSTTLAQEYDVTIGTIGDGQGGSVIQRVTVTIDAPQPPVNDAPIVAAAVSGSGAEGSGTFTVELLQGASDPDSPVLHVANLVWNEDPGSLPSGFTLGSDGNSISVDTSNAAYDGLTGSGSFASHFSYDVVDGQGALVHQSATVTVAGRNDAPSFGGDRAFTVAEGGIYRLTSADLAAVDPDNTASQLTYDVNPQHGYFTVGSATVTSFTQSQVNTQVEADAVFYHHDGSETTSDPFTIGLRDGLASVSGSFTVTVLPVNDKPVAGNGAFVTNEDTPFSGSLPAATDADAGDVVAYALVSSASAQSGTVTLSGSSFVYTPRANFNGPDSFSYSVSDGHGGTNTYVMTVTVAAVNDAPTVSGSATLAPISEDAAAPPGATIASLFGFTFFDAADSVPGGSNPNTLAGIAIGSHTADPAKGAWQYQLGGAGPWTALPNATDATAVTLGVADLLRFVPAANYNGAATALSAHLIESGQAITGGGVLNLTGATGGATHVSTGTVALAETINAVNHAPVIDGSGTVIASVTSGDIVGHLHATDPDTGDIQTWTVVDPSGVQPTIAPHAPAYSFRINEFKVIGSDVAGTNVVAFDDTFDDGIATVAGPTPFGFSYGLSGALTEADGFGVLDDAHGATVSSVGGDTLYRGSYVSLLTNMSGSGTLSRDSSFSVTGDFDLTQPDDLLEEYGIRLDDNYGQVGNDRLQLVVRKGGTGEYRVQFRDTDLSPLAMTTTNIQNIFLNPTNGENEIRLHLNHVANSSDITASFDLLIRDDFGAETLSRSVSFTRSGQIFTGETWTRAQFFADTPEPSQSYIKGQYGTLFVNALGSWDYASDNRAATLGLNASGVAQTAQEHFQLRVTDAGGLSDTRDVTITVVGANDAPVAGDDVATVASGSASGNVLANDADVDAADTLSVAFVRTGPEFGSGSSGAVGSPLHGAYGDLTLGADGAFTYTVTAASAGANAVDLFTYRAADGHGGFNLATLQINVPQFDQAPAFLPMSTASGSVTENDVDHSQTVGRFLATDDDVASALTWTVSNDGGVGSAIHLADFHVAIDEFKVTRNGNPFFDDTFSDGVAPPSAPNFAGGTAATYGINGSLTESVGLAYLNSANASDTDGIATDAAFRNITATLQSNNAPTGTAGLREANDFTVEGRFALSLPQDIRHAYGIRLTDQHGIGGNYTTANDGDDVVDLLVRRDVDDVVRVELFQKDFVADTSVLLGAYALTPSEGDDTIVLKFEHASGSTHVTASFQLYAGAVLDTENSHSFDALNQPIYGKIFGAGHTATGPDHTVEDWTRARFFTSAPTKSDTVIDGVYGKLTLDQSGAWFYTLDNARKATNELSVTVEDWFNVTVTDVDGNAATSPIVVTVVGIDDPLVVDVPNAANGFTNGQFASGTNPGAAQVLMPGQTALPGWTIPDIYSAVRYVGSGWQSSDGDGRSIDVDHGRLTQTFATTAGVEYTVRFDLAADPSLSFDHELQVSVDGYQFQNYVFETNSGTTTSAMGWRPETFTFVATDSQTTLGFSSVGQVSSPAIDNVSVTSSASNQRVILEAPTGASQGTHVLSGHIYFNDPDTYVTVFENSRTVEAVTGFIDLTPEQIDSIYNAFIPEVTGDGHTGSVDWTYSITDEALDFLGEGEVAELTSHFTIDGGATTYATEVTIQFRGVNDAPVLAGGGPLSYTEGDAAAVIASDLTVSDVDSHLLHGAAVAIAGGYEVGEDVLAYDDLGNGITGNFGSSTGVLTFTGDASVEDYQSILRSVTFSYGSGSAQAPEERTVTFTVDDGAAHDHLSNAVDVSITVNPAPTPPQLVTVNDHVIASFYVVEADIPDEALLFNDIDANPGIDLQISARSAISAGSFTYTATDNSGDPSNEATVTVAIGGPSSGSILIASSGSDETLNGAGGKDVFVIPEKADGGSGTIHIVDFNVDNDAIDLHFIPNLVTDDNIEGYLRIHAGSNDAHSNLEVQYDSSGAGDHWVTQAVIDNAVGSGDAFTLIWANTLNSPNIHTLHVDGIIGGP